MLYVHTFKAFEDLSRCKMLLLLVTMGQPFPLHFKQTFHSSSGARAKTNLSHIFVLSLLDYFGCYSIPGIAYTVRKTVL